MDDLGFPRTPDRPVKLLGTRVRYQRSVETMIDARGHDFLGGSATNTISKWTEQDSTRPTPPSSSIRCVQNDFRAYGMFGANRAQIMCQD